MAKGTTVFERFKERRRLAGMTEEAKAINPLELDLGAVVSLDYLDWREFDFILFQIRVVIRHIGDREFPMVDYYLLHRGLTDGDEIRRVLRYVPLDEPDPDSGLTHQAYLMDLVDEHEHNEAEVLVLAQNNGFTHFRENPDWEEGSDLEQWVEHTYPHRVNDIQAPYDCSVELLKDTDHDGTVEEEEIEKFEITLWDFGRIQAVEGGEDQTDFLFVEIERENGWTDIFTAEMIDPAMVII